jgi:hypothetical protein
MSTQSLTANELIALRETLRRDLRQDLLDEVKTLIAERPGAPPPEYLRVEEACRYMQIGTATLYKLRKMGLPSVRIDGLLYLRVSDINSFLAAHPVINE